MGQCECACMEYQAFWSIGIIMYKSKKPHEIYPDKILQSE